MGFNNLGRFLSSDVLAVAENMLSNRINEIVYDIGDYQEHDAHLYLTENLQARILDTLKTTAMGELNTFILAGKDFLFKSTFDGLGKALGPINLTIVESKASKVEESNIKLTSNLPTKKNESKVSEDGAKETSPKVATTEDEEPVTLDKVDL